MKNLLKYLFLFFASFFFSLISLSCSYSCNDLLEAKGIPLEIFAKANNYIKDKMTEPYFNKYATFDPWNTSRNYFGYTFCYNFRIPDRPFVNAHIRIKTDSLGVIDEKQTDGIPNIKSDPIKGRFDIDEEKARQIAIKAGLEPGIDKWEICFNWDYSLTKYVWSIKNALAISNNGWDKGKTLIIDANTGEVTGPYEWTVFY
jgi:hypothetical protein